MHGTCTFCKKKLDLIGWKYYSSISAKGPSRAVNPGTQGVQEMKRISRIQKEKIPIEKYPFNRAYRIDDLGKYSETSKIYGCAIHNIGALYPFYTTVEVTENGNIYSIPER
jgi:hypothetical protein